MYLNSVTLSRYIYLIGYSTERLRSSVLLETWRSSTSLIRVCQPLPVALKCSATSGASRSVTCCLAAFPKAAARAA